MPKKDLPAAPQSLLLLLTQGRIRELNDVVDLAAEVASALVQGDMNANTARELRQWAELMYTSIQAQNISGDVDVNFVTQLVQIAGGQAAVENAPRNAIETAQHPVIEAEPEPEKGKPLIEIESLIG